jgi:hypothetical protein
MQVYFARLYLVDYENNSALTPMVNTCSWFGIILPHSCLHEVDTCSFVHVTYRIIYFLTVYCKPSRSINRSQTVVGPRSNRRQLEHQSKTYIFFRCAVVITYEFLWDLLLPSCVVSLLLILTKLQTNLNLTPTL